MNENTATETVPAEDKSKKLINILSIDAWRTEDGGWTWNNWHKVGQCELAVAGYPPRKLFRYMREEGYLTEGSAGKVSKEDDQFNIVILDKNTREPLFALEYGPAVR